MFADFRDSKSRFLGIVIGMKILENFWNFIVQFSRYCPNILLFFEIVDFCIEI